MPKEETQHYYDLSERISDVENRLDKHIDVYRANGKESKRVADALEVMIDQNKEMYEMFSTFKGGWTMGKWIFGFFVAIGGAVVIWQKITKG